MANQTESYKAESKFTGVWIRPENLTIVGIDCPDEDMPDFADPHRINLPYDDILPSIAEFGIREAVHVRKFRGDDRVYVVSGRRRVRAAREANESRARGDVPVLVPCLPDDGDPLVGLTIENEGRIADTPYARACKARRMKERGLDDASIGRVFNISKSGLRVWWLVLEAQPAVQRAVEHGKITMTAASEIAKLKPADQVDALKQAITDGKGAVVIDNVRAKRKAVDKGGSASDAPRRLPLQSQKAFAEALKAGVPDGADLPVPEPLQIGAAVMAAILGEGVAALAPWPELQQAYQTAIAPKSETATRDAS